MSAQQDDDKYIRTFAKDMAQAQGKPLPEPTTPADQPSAPSDVTTADAKRQEILERLKARTQMESVSRAPLMPEAPTAPVPAPMVQDAPAPVLPEAPPAKPISSWKEGELPTYAPQAPVPTVYREPIPEHVELPTVAPKVEVAREPAIVAPQPIARTQTPDEPSPLHTYSGDFAQKIDSQTASTFSVLAAQADAGQRITTTRDRATSKRSMVFVGLGIALIALGGAGAITAYWYTKIKNTVVVQDSVPSLIFADDRVELSGEGSQLVQALMQGVDAPIQMGGVRIFYLTQSSSTPSGTTKIALPGGYLLGALQLNAPDILIRNVGKESTVGAVQAGTDQRFFMVLKVLSYERTFAGMLSWEPTIQASLSAFYPLPEAPLPPPPTIATTTRIVKGKVIISTTTVQSQAPIQYAPHFVDEVSANHNVRALKDSSGNTILLYGYKDKETLIIARDEAAFGRILERLGATSRQ